MKKQFQFNNKNQFIIFENEDIKHFKSRNYNYTFDKNTGFFARWGKTKWDDPQVSPFGPEILDIEITTKCKGPDGKHPCKFCYKQNNSNGKNMSFETFKKVIDNMPRTLTQCAFGADAQLISNPDIWKMFDYARNNERNPIIPNITIANITDEAADKLSEKAGAVAISAYEVDKNLCYDSVKKLTDRGMDQVNIHLMIANETERFAYSVLNDIKHDKRLEKLNAIVFLSLKRCGGGKYFNQLPQNKFNYLVEFCLENEIPFGFDSCSYPKFVKAIKGIKNEKQLIQMSEPCESSTFSMYCNVEGKYFPCSFTETGNGIDLTKENLNFVDDVWNNRTTKQFRKLLFKNNRNCPVYKI